MNFISLLLSFLFGILTMYLTAYTKEKGKVKALREDVAKIEDEKQKVISKYQKEIYLQSFIDVKALIFLEYNNI